MENSTTSEQPNGAGLLVLGVLSLLLGPFTAVPGLILSKRFRPFTPSAAVGYFLCWLMVGVTCLVLLVYTTRQAGREPQRSSNSADNTPAPCEAKAADK